jgi:hypothetical protein
MEAWGQWLSQWWVLMMPRMKWADSLLSLGPRREVENPFGDSSMG